MYRLQVNDISDLSYGQKYLLDLIDERKLAIFLKDGHMDLIEYAWMI